MDDNRKMLLKRVQVCDFVLDETALFLDTHPTNKAALDYYKKYQEMKRKATAEFTSKYGPLTAEEYNYSDYWRWVDNPWPWDMEANV